MMRVKRCLSYQVSPSLLHFDGENGLLGCKTLFGLVI